MQVRGKPSFLQFLQTDVTTYSERVPKWDFKTSQSNPPLFLYINQLPRLFGEYVSYQCCASGSLMSIFRCTTPDSKVYRLDRTQPQVPSGCYKKREKGVSYQIDWFCPVFPSIRFASRCVEKFSIILFKKPLNPWKGTTPFIIVQAKGCGTQFGRVYYFGGTKKKLRNCVFFWADFAFENRSIDGNSRKKLWHFLRIFCKRSIWPWRTIVNKKKIWRIKKSKKASWRRN